MATYAVAAAEIAAWAKVLVAATVDTVNFARRCPQIKVVNDSGTSPIYFTVDGTAPTVGGLSTYRVPASANAETIVDITAGGPTTVKLISAGTPTYSVEGSV